jgi:hypothetical protein
LYFSAQDYAASHQRLLDMDVAILAQAHRYRWSAPTQEAVRTGPEVRQTLQESLGVCQAIESAVRAKLAQDPAITIRALVEHVVRATAADLDNDPEMSPIPAGTVNTVAAHWREARGG